MNTTSKWLAIVAVAFVAGSFVASPELRVYAANTVFSSDITDGEVKTADLASNAVTAAKIKDAEVKAAEIAANAVGSSEIATDAVGAAEIQGVTKLLFMSCNISLTSFGVGATGSAGCNAPGVQTGDRVMTTLNADSTATSRHCVVPTSSFAGDGNVLVRYRNACDSSITAPFTAELIVFKQ